MANDKKIKHVFGSLQPDIENLLELGPEDFAPASKSEKESFIADRKSVSYWADAWRRLRKNTVAIVSLIIVILIALFAFVGPMIVPYGNADFTAGGEDLPFYHYTLEDQARINEVLQAKSPDEAVAEAEAKAAAEGKTLSAVDKAKIRAKAASSSTEDVYDSFGNRLTGQKLIDYWAKQLGISRHFGGYSVSELERRAAGEFVFPHVFGTDMFGRDFMVRVMIGTRVSMLVGIVSAILVLVIGAIYGSISGYAGGKVDTIMQRIVELIYAIPEVLVILLISTVLGISLGAYQLENPGTTLSNIITLLGPNLIGMFIAFALLYWVTMSRIIRGQIMQLKEMEYVTAARALGATSGRVIKRHLLPNCIGQIVVTTCLQIPSAIFLESFLSYLGVGVSAPLTSLGSMCADALNGLNSFPHRMLFPAVILSIMILTLNLFGDGLRDALDPKLKK